MNNHKINIILAVDKHFGLGYKYNMAWDIPEELAIFKEKTINNTIILGHQTYKYMPRIKNRNIICISRTPKHSFTDNLKFTTSIESALLLAEQYNKPIFICGGNQIYQQFFNNFDNSKIRIHISIINEIFKCDTFFDKKFLNNFYIIEEQKYKDFTHYILDYKKYGEYQYLNILNEVLINGDERCGRNGNVISSFVKHLKFDLRDGFPLLTTKKMFLKGIIEELLFFIRGDTNSKILEEKGINIWKGNTSREFLDKAGFNNRPDGVMGPLYGFQWRFFGAEYDEKEAKHLSEGIDQLQNVINLINNDPTSRRILLTSYNPKQANDGVLYPCHSLIIQFYVNGEFLDMFCYNRSQDVFLGTPFNISSSALLLIIIAQITNKKPRYLNMSMGDTHIYENHIKSVKEQIERIPYIFPIIKFPNFSSLKEVEKLTFEDFELLNYNYYPSIKATMVP